jgi:hypothetical protein
VSGNPDRTRREGKARHEYYPPTAIILYGHSCAGKSTVGRKLAGLFPKCAYIEVVELRQKIIGGHVGSPRDPGVLDAPAAHTQQRLIADENASLLAHNFIAHGFSAVIEGLEDTRNPGKGWVESHFETVPLLNDLLMCDEETFLKRLTERGWADGVNLKPGRKRNFDWYLDNQDRFDFSVRTDVHSPDRAADLIYDAVLGRKSP